LVEREEVIDKVAVGAAPVPVQSGVRALQGIGGALGASRHGSNPALRVRAGDPRRG